MEAHLANIPKDLTDKKSQETGFRKKQVWRPVELDLMIRLMPLWMDRVHRYLNTNELEEAVKWIQKLKSLATN